MNAELNWKPPSNRPDLDVVSALSAEALKLVSEHMPALADLFPFKNPPKARLDFSGDWVGLIMDWVPTLGHMTFERLKPEEHCALETAANSIAAGSFEQLRGLLPEEYFSCTRFTYVGPYQDGFLSWTHLMQMLTTWINTLVLPRVLDLNRSRVLVAIPQPPQFNLQRLAKAVWVLECEETSRQGTAFMLDGVGLVTCEHVLGPNTQAFRADNPVAKWPIKVCRKNTTIDLAVIETMTDDTATLIAGSADNLQQMDHLGVYGYPNFRVGDTGVFVPGLVVGFRTVSGIRRILTNAPIVAGASGSPVLGADGKVIGVAVTGADRLETAHHTEDHGIVPIDALVHL